MASCSLDADRTSWFPAQLPMPIEEDSQVAGRAMNVTPRSTTMRPNGLRSIWGLRAVPRPSRRR